MSSGNHGGAYHIDILNRWQRPGDITNVPRLDVAQVAAFGAASTRWLIDASFLNIRSVNLFYNLPQSLAQRMAMQNVRLYVSAENLAFFSKRKGMEPQQSFGGVTGNFYSPARTVTFGINLSF